MRTEKKCVFVVMICFFVTILFLPGLGAQDPSHKTPSHQLEPESTQENVSEEKQPHIAIDAATYDAGDIYEGARIINTFIIKNTGTAELAIADVKAG